MEELTAVRSPVFPLENDVDVSSDAEPLSQTSSIQVFIKLAEPVVFIQGFNQTQQSETPPSMLRGSLILRVLKPSKLKSVSLSFKGYSRTEWPEGIPPKRQEFVEVCDIVNHVWPFYQNDGSTTTSGLTHTDDNSFLLRESGASIYKSLESVRNRRGSFSAHSPRSSFNFDAENGGGDHQAGGRKRSTSNTGPIGLGVTTGGKDVSTTSTSNRTLSPMSILRRATSPSPNKHDRSSNLISDLLSSTFSNSNEQNSRRGSASSAGGGSGIGGSGNSHLTVNGDSGSTSGSGDHFVFQPGDYIYTFEQAIPTSYPETIKADFGFVEYQLFASIERVGAFKSNVTARLPVPLIRTQSDSSVEETEPIAISRDWEDQLHYDIVIASKDIILDAFLPIAFHFAPLDKVTLHRIRIYLTETMEYYCRGKKVHRMEPTRKFLLAEHNGPNIMHPEEKGPLKAKNMGNLLLEESSADLVNKDYEYQVFVPSIVSDRHVIHPDTSFDKVKSNHWIKLCLRLSRMIDGKRKHYEISIDSPIHVLHKLCSHANTLLPSYDSHVFTNEQALNACPKFGNTGDVNIYHDSNIFFPKEVLLSPILSPEVHSMDVKLANSIRSSSQKPVRNRDRRNSRAGEDFDPTFASPKLRSNIYQPETIPRELASPQAVPFSPVSSPLLRSISPWIAPPPSFDFNNDEFRPFNDLPLDPPTYTDVLKYDELEKEQKNSSTSKPPEVPKITLSKLNEEKPTLDEQLAGDYSLDPLSRQENLGNTRNSLEASLKGNENDAEDDGDIASGFNFQGASKTSPNLPVAVLRSPIMHPVNPGLENKSPPRASLTTSTLPTKDAKTHAKSSLPTDTLPSTVRNDSSGLTGLGEILDEDPPGAIPMTNRNDTNGSISSSVGRSSSFDSVAALANKSNLVPLLQRSDSRHNASVDDFAMQSRDSIANYTEAPVDTSVDITALYDRNSSPWHPLQMSMGPDLSPVVSPSYSSNVADRNHVIDDFKEALHFSPYSQDSGMQNANDSRHSGSPFASANGINMSQHSNIRMPPATFQRSSPEKQLVNEVGTEATSPRDEGSFFCR
ncbi:hypothetical protein ZYGR_0AD03850 [Zygosaccharomyces rouxii]|uniref:Arrestin C-terminal-like domain-containing protein n=1 Tax=Zygosaccharomyces rouxii TaxID=4956 RepID=A0A1Q3A670_ZYGRO|nr:hypothetical protein ZYGR_0AD03850 [Zygosaccharomyces rouxii]